MPLQTQVSAMHLKSAPGCKALYKNLSLPLLTAAMPVNTSPLYCECQCTLAAWGEWVVGSQLPWCARLAWLVPMDQMAKHYLRVGSHHVGCSCFLPSFVALMLAQSSPPPPPPRLPPLLPTPTQKPWKAHAEYRYTPCRPFLLPCISAAFISFLALQSSMFLLKETLPSKVARKYSRLQQADEEQGMPPEPADVNDQGLFMPRFMALICCVLLIWTGSSSVACTLSLCHNCSWASDSSLCWKTLEQTLLFCGLRHPPPPTSPTPSTSPTPPPARAPTLYALRSHISMHLPERQLPTAFSQHVDALLVMQAGSCTSCRPPLTDPPPLRGPP